MNKKLVIKFLLFLSFVLFFFIRPIQINASNSSDLNNDNKVDIYDYNILVNNWNKTGNPGWIKSDINTDGTVNNLDYQILQTNFGQNTTPPPINIPTSQPSVPPTQSPIPSTNPNPPTNGVKVGARFFASFPSTDSVTRTTHSIRNAHEQLLSFQEWRNRLPYYSIIRPDGSVDIHQDDQRVIDQDIILASTAGLDFWLFEPDITSPGHTLFNYPLDLYMSSQYKNQLKFAIMIQAKCLYDDNWENKCLNNLKNYLLDTQYLKVINNRPILFMGSFIDFVEKLGVNGAKNRMQLFLEKAEQQIGKKPFLVMVDLYSGDYIYNAKDYYFEARTPYIGNHSNTAQGLPFTDLNQANINEWNSYRQHYSEINFIPMVTIGFDIRLKAKDPLLFGSGNYIRWYKQGTPYQIAQQVNKAIDWVNNYSNVTSKTKMVLLSAWSEPTESGWLEPTLGEQNQRLNALSQVLGGSQMNMPQSPYANNPPVQHPLRETTLNIPVVDGKPTLTKVDGKIPISGRADIAAEINIKIKKGSSESTLYFINGKGTYPTRQFSVKLPSLPNGDGYTLTVTGDVQPILLENVRIVQ